MINLIRDSLGCYGGNNMAAAEAGVIPGWLTILLITLAGVALAFFLKSRREKQQERGKRRQEALVIHFRDLRVKVIDEIIAKTSHLSITLGQLTFGTESRFPPKYSFEEGDNYTSFKYHFSEEFAQWGNLKKEILELNQKYKELPDIERRFGELKKMQANQRPENWESEHAKYESDFKERSIAFREEFEKANLQKECISLSRSLSEKIDDITKYGMGKEFKKIKNCPICNKFH